jgi:localization factor PodJL
MGVKSDRAKARALYEKAAGHGNLKAMHNLAVITASTTAGNPDYATAARLFERAAQHGLRDSQYNLGVLYERGLGVAKDHAAAYRWYALAARSGDSMAARRRDSLIAKLPSQTIQAVDAKIASWQPEPANEAANDARAFGAAHVQRRASASHR